MNAAVTSRKATGSATATQTRVAVLMGGDSSEREVSLESGRAVLESLRGAGVQVFPFDPAESGIGEMLRRTPAVAFLALHGKGGEDGAIQRKLESLGVRYTGCGPASSALAMDKILTKKAFLHRGIPTPPFRILKREDLSRAEALTEDLGYPLVVKPAREGSSIGISIARSRFGLLEALDVAFRHGDAALVEKRIEGREFCVGILGRETLPVVEVVFADEFFSFRAKYQDTRTQYRFDTGLPPEAIRTLEQTSLAAFDALGCRHYGRVDVILSPGDWTPYVLEVNTLPGMTSHSLLPKAARHGGMSFTALCLRILEMAQR